MFSFKAVLNCIGFAQCGTLW